MPVFEWDLDLQASEWDWREAAGPIPDVSEDFWRKFEELPDLPDDLESLIESASCHNDPSNMLRHHDCMWAGMCLSKEHKSLVSGALLETKKEIGPPPLIVQHTPPQPPVNIPIARQPATNTTVPTNIINKTPNQEKPTTKREPRRKGVIVQKTVGRSLLINSRSRIPEPTRPETPPSLSESEEDEKKIVPVVLPISEVTNQVSVRTPVQEQHNMQTTNLNVQFDHNYDKSVRIDDLGVQTPSDSEEEEDEEEDDDDDDDDDDEEGEEEDVTDGEDSEEEEIDVVSLNNTTVRMRQQPSSLPYNPSREIRRELQETMASAINTNKMYSVGRTVNRRINNGSGRRKRKRSESYDEDEETTFMQQQQQQALLNSRIMATSSSNSSTINTTNFSRTTSPSRYHQTHHRRTWKRTTTTTTTTSTPKKSRFSTDSETDCEKRSLHNNMERMRRIGLRNAFEDLRVLIPTLEDAKRAAKVNILKDSAIYIRQLTAQERNFAQKVVSLRHDQEKLRSKLSKLRRSLAAQR